MTKQRVIKRLDVVNSSQLKSHPIMQSVNGVHIETQNLCTRRCWYCKFGLKRQDPSVNRMSDELIEKIADNLQDLGFSGRISPFSINEPLLDPRMHDIIRLFRSRCPQAFISLASNGDLLTDEMLRSLISAGLDGMGLSCHDDSAWKRLKPFTRYSIVRLIDMRHDEDILTNRGGEVPLRNSTPQINKPCLMPSKVLDIRPNGDVVLCCNDMYSDVVMGNVTFQRIEEIWNSERFLYYRSRLSSGERQGLELCQTCNSDGLPCNEKFPFEDFDWIPKPVRKAIYRYTPEPLKWIVKKCLGVSSQRL